MRRAGPMTRLSNLPEANVALFAFLLNYPWEFLQVPFFEGMADAPHWEAVKFCTRATLGDAVIALVAFWSTTFIMGSRGWIGQGGRLAIAVFIAAGVCVTVVLERLATGPLERWAYSDQMPVVPVLQVGLLPLVQWIVLPLLLILLVRRQLYGRDRL
jgi:hypothetical protein